MSCQNKKVGIMGGTFDPIHYGHLILAQNALDTFSLDEILFVPSGTPWLKESTKVLSKNKRVSMTGMAIEDNPDFALSTIEIDREGNSYSYETVEELKRLQPKTDFYFIMGADSLLEIERWKHPDRLMTECTYLSDRQISGRYQNPACKQNRYFFYENPPDDPGREICPLYAA